MAKSGAKRRRTVRPVKGFKEVYKGYLKRDPSIAEKFHLFNVNKRKIPPEQLPRGMKDHKLKGVELWECHLAPNILLIYRYEDNIVRLVSICGHDDLK
jgi:addiction module RelE/StbE family toxin